MDFNLGISSMFFMIFLGMSLKFKYCGMYAVCLSSTSRKCDVEVEPGRDLSAVQAGRSDIVTYKKAR